jgi:predicted secreted protein
MKTSLIIVFLVIANIAFRKGCRSNAVESPSAIRLKSGDSVMQQLDGNVASGYLWSVAIDDPSVISVQNPTLSMVQNETLSGEPHHFCFKIKGKHSGKTNVHFVYKKPWQNNALTQINKTIEVEAGDTVNPPALAKK